MLTGSDTIDAPDAPVRAAQLDGLELVRCSSRHELRLAADFREILFEAKIGYAYRDARERSTDRVSQNLLLRRHGQPLATARCQPFPSTHGTIPRWVPPSEWPVADSEVNRVSAVSSDDKKMLRHSMLVLTLGAMWMYQLTFHRIYLAHCHPNLLTLYNMVGAQQTGVIIPGDSRLSGHLIIRGTYRDCIDRGLDCLGLTRDEASTVIRWTASAQRPG